MLDDKDLQAIKELIDTVEDRITKKTKEQIDAVEDRITKKTKELIDAAEERITKKTITLMDAEFTPKFNLLAEGIQTIQETLVPRTRVDALEEEIKFLKIMVRQMAEQINELKQAN